MGICQTDTIKPRVVTLPSVEVKSHNYTSDSISRSIYYRDLLSKKTKQLISTSAHFGFGFVISPITYFSKAATRERQLRKRIAHREKEAYIDYMFPVERVRQLSKLPPDSFQIFYYHFRPSYKSARKMDKSKLPAYIDQSLLIYRKTNKSSKKKSR